MENNLNLKQIFSKSSIKVCKTFKLFISVFFFRFSDFAQIKYYSSFSISVTLDWYGTEVYNIPYES